jgi:hypothetical protein
MVSAVSLTIVYDMDPSWLFAGAICVNASIKLEASEIWIELTTF